MAHALVYLGRYGLDQAEAVAAVIHPLVHIVDEDGPSKPVLLPFLCTLDLVFKAHVTIGIQDRGT